jgi:hypothetical protein
VSDPSSPENKPKELLDEWLGSQDFYEVMYAYRTAPMFNQDKVVEAFEKVKTVIRQKVEEVYGSKEDFITVYESVGGWKAVQLTWSLLHENNPASGFWEPYTTGTGAYATEAEAVREGKAWARAEGLEFKERTNARTSS